MPNGLPLLRAAGLCYIRVQWWSGTCYREPCLIFWWYPQSMLSKFTRIKCATAANGIFVFPDVVWFRLTMDVSYYLSLFKQVRLTSRIKQLRIAYRYLYKALTKHTKRTGNRVCRWALEAARDFATSRPSLQAANRVKWHVQVILDTSAIFKKWYHYFSMHYCDSTM